MNKILNIIFPKIINNNFYSSKLALYVFYIITLITLWRSQHHLIAADGGAQSIATIPLDTFATIGSEAVISIFAFWELSQLIIGILYLIASIKYKSLIPLLYVLMFLEYLIRLIIDVFKPLPTIDTAPGQIGNYIFMAISSAMLVLILKSYKTHN